jgi:hypothetical protein
LHVAGSEDENVLGAYLMSHGLAGVNLLAKTLVEGLSATPTILVIDSAGRVERSWQGVMSRSQKAELKRLL